MATEKDLESQGSNYAVHQNLYEYLGSDMFTQAQTSASALKSLELLGDLKTKSANWNDPQYKAMVVEETKYLDQAIKALHENGRLADKFGKGLNSAMALATFIRKENIDAEVKDLVAPYLPHTSDPKTGYRKAFIDGNKNVR